MKMYIAAIVLNGVTAVAFQSPILFDFLCCCQVNDNCLSGMTIIINI